MNFEVENTTTNSVFNTSCFICIVWNDGFVLQELNMLNRNQIFWRWNHNIPGESGQVKTWLLMP